MRNKRTDVDAWALPGGPTEGQVEEALASYAHKAWSGWMKYLFKESFYCPQTGTVTLPRWAVYRWQRQMETAYEDLPEKEKQSDRKEARKMLAILKRLGYARRDDQS